MIKKELDEMINEIGKVLKEYGIDEYRTEKLLSDERVYGVSINFTFDN
ncbi:hypothetical protein ACW2QC_09340 [Virgibacillus sp. FSP13]